MVCLKSTRKHADDYVEFTEFRLFLHALRVFFEYYQAFSRYDIPFRASRLKYDFFSRLDSGNDGRVSKEEFLDNKIRESIETVGGL